MGLKIGSLGFWCFGSVIMLMVGIWCVPVGVLVCFVGVEMAVFGVLCIRPVMAVGVMPIMMVMAMVMG